MAIASARAVHSWAETTRSQELAIIAYRAREITNASGAAIALLEDNSGELVCFTRSGSMAPDIGATVSVEGSFVGLSVQTGKQLCCEDTAADARGYVAALNSIGIRSLAVTPIHLNNRVIGVLVIFADAPGAFSAVNLSRLNAMASQIAVLVPEKQALQGTQHRGQSLAHTSPDASRPNPPVPAMDSTLLQDFATADMAARQLGKERTRLLVSGVAATLMIASTLVWSFLKMRESAVAGPVTGLQHAKNNVETPRQTAVPTAGLPQASAHSPRLNPNGITGQHGESPGGERQAALPARPSSRFEPSTMQSMRSNSGSNASEASNAGLPIEPPNPATPAAPVSVNFVPAQLVHVLAPVYPAGAKPSLATETVVLRFTVGKDGRVMNPEFLKGLPAFKRAALDAVGQWQYTPALTNGKPVEQQMEVSLDIDPSTPSQAAPSSAGPSDVADANAKLPMTTQAGFVPAQLVRSVRPVYPALARQWLTIGTVVVRVKVERDGRVADPEVLRGPMLFRRAALDAVRQWQYRPAMANGQPVDQQIEVSLDFRPL